MSTYRTSEISSDPDIKHIPKFGGNLWFVDGTNGLDTNSGTQPTNAFATIGKAIVECSSGDSITVMAGNYTETGLDINKNNIELWCEIGTRINPASGTCLIISGSYCWIGCDRGSLKVENDSAAATGVLITGNFVYLEDVRVSCNSTGEIGFDIQGNGADLRRCRCSSPLTAAFKIQGDKVKLEACCTGGQVANTSYGYWITNSCDQFRLLQCGSQGHSSGGFRVDSGCTNGVVWQFSSGGGDGKWQDIDSSTVVSDLTYEKIKYATMTLNGGTAYNLFKITGSVKVYNIHGHITTVIANTSSTMNLELYSTNGSVEITDDAGAPDIQADVVGTVYSKLMDVGEPLLKAEPASTPALSESTDFRDPNNPLILVEDNGADTYIQAVLSDAVASGVIHWHIEWEPVTDDGFLEPA